MRPKFFPVLRRESEPVQRLPHEYPSPRRTPAGLVPGLSGLERGRIEGYQHRKTHSVDRTLRWPMELQVALERLKPC